MNNNGKLILLKEITNIRIFPYFSLKIYVKYKKTKLVAEAMYGDVSMYRNNMTSFIACS